MALFVAPSVPRFDATPSTSSRSSAQRRGGDTLRKPSSSLSETCLGAALAVQTLRGRGKRRILRLGTAISLEPSVRETWGQIVVDKELLDQLNFSAAKGQVSSTRALFEQILASAKVQRGTVRSSQKAVPLSMLYATMLKALANAGDVRGAQELAYRAREEDVEMNNKFYGKLLEAASKAGDVVMANKWFEESKAAGNRGPVHFNMMVEAYAKAGELDEAKKWIQRTRDAGVPTVTNMFNSLIFAYASRGQMKEAAGVIREMLQEGHDPEVSSFAALAVVAAQEGDDEAAERWMQQARDRKLEYDNFDAEVSTQAAYARLASASSTPEVAESWLRRLQETGGTPSVENFSVVVDAFAKQGQVDKALELMEEMKDLEVPPSVVTYSSAMHAWTKAGNLDRAASTLTKMMQIRLAPDGVAYGTVMDGFAKAGKPDDVIQMAEQMKANGIPVTVRHQNSILEALVKAGKPNDAARWLLQMSKRAPQSRWQRNMDEPDVYSYAMVMGALASAGRVSSVESLNQAMQLAGTEATPLLHEVVMRGYLDAKKMKDAYRWLQEADASGISLNANLVCCAIDVCLRNRKAEEGSRWLERIQEANIPVPTQGSRAVLFHISAVKCCAEAGDVDAGFDWLQRAENAGLNSERKGKGKGVPLRPAYLALMKAFAFRSMEILLRVLESLEEAEESIDLMARCELIELLASKISREDALVLLQRVKDEGKLSVFLFSRTISACTKAGRVDEAIFWFEEMQRAGIEPDTVAWNSIINACARAGRAAEAELLLGKMKASGSTPDVVSYNIVINLCAHTGRPQEAQNWLKQMQEARIQPDEVTYAAVISALTKANMVDEAIDMLGTMEDMGLRRNQVAYARVVTGLGRAGRAREAAAWLFQMEEAGFKVIAPVYNWVIAACKRPPNAELAERVARRLLATQQMPNEFCVSTLRQILGPERFSALQAEIPLLHRAVAEVAQERRRHQAQREAGSPERRASPQRRKGKGKGRGPDKVNMIPP